MGLRRTRNSYLYRGPLRQLNTMQKLMLSCDLDLSAQFNTPWPAHEACNRSVNIEITQAPLKSDKNHLALCWMGQPLLLVTISINQRLTTITKSSILAIFKGWWNGTIFITPNRSDLLVLTWHSSITERALDPRAGIYLTVLGENAAGFKMISTHVQSEFLAKEISVSPMTQALGFPWGRCLAPNPNNIVHKDLVPITVHSSR